MNEALLLATATTLTSVEVVYMPIEVGIWRINGAPERVYFSALEAESKLEDVLAHDISILDPGLMIIGRQVPTAYGKYIDLLAIDSEGDLTIIELKRDKTPRDVVAQALDYGSWVQTLTYDKITALFNDNHTNQRFEEAFSSKFGASPLEQLNESQHLVVVAGELDNSTERIIAYLSTGFGVPINAVFFRYFKEGTHEYLTRTWLMDPNQPEAQGRKLDGRKTSKEPWNGQDYYVSIGEGVHRTWEDCQKYGFVSAGHGRWYSNSLNLLDPGARIFACIPKTGYVGVGTVTEKAVPVTEFKVLIDGREIPILEASRKATNMGDDADDPEMCEYLVRVEWLKTVPASQAVWEKGMFANQNSACKLRNKFTLDHLVQRFGLTEE